MWKNKLEETSELSFATLQNKDAAWEKLQDRLEEKTQKRFAVWYWVAAACIMIVASIPFITNNKVNDVVRSTNNITKQQEKTIIKKDKAEQNMVAETAAIHQPKKEKQQAYLIKAGIRKEIIADPSKQVDVANNNVITNESTTIKTLPVIINDTNAIAATSAIKKKLKVVHVNELGEPVEETETATHNADLHLFQLKLAQQEIYNASSMAASSNSNLIFKSKKPSN